MQHQIKLSTTSFVNLSTPEIESEYLSQIVIYRNFRHRGYSFTHPMERSAYFYPYYPISPHKVKIASFSKDYQEFLNKEFKQIVKYQPILSSKFYDLNEIFIKFNLAPNKDAKILEFGIVPILLEYINYKNYDCEHEFIHFSKYNKTQDNLTYDAINNLIKPFKKIKDFILTNIGGNLYELFDMNISKKDIICNMFKYIDPEISWVYTNYSHIFKSILTIFSLKTLNIGGAYIILTNLTTKADADLYLILKKFFSSVNIYVPEICNLYGVDNIYLICKGFKGLSGNDIANLMELVKQIRQIYPNDLDDYNIYNENDRKNFYITKPISGQPRAYIKGYLKSKLSDPIYHDVINFNKQYYITVLQRVKNVDKILNISEEELPTLPTIDQIHTSILYCKKWDIPYNDYYNLNNKISSLMGYHFLSELYSLQVPLIYEFKTDTQNYLIKSTRKKRTHKKTSRYSLDKLDKSNTSTQAILEEYNLQEFIDLFSKKDKLVQDDINLINQLSKSNNKFHQYELIYKSKFDIVKNKNQQVNRKFKKIQDLLGYSVGNQTQKKSRKDSLQIILKQKINSNINDKWIVLYEILHNIDVVPKNKLVKLYHTSRDNLEELNCLYYYLKTHKKQHVLQHNFSFEFPKKLSVIIDNKPYINSNLIIDTNGTHKNNYHPTICNFVNALYLLATGGSLIFKLSIPLRNPVILYLVFICYQYFEELIFYKPIQVSDTKSFYLIGKNLSPIIAEVFGRVFPIIENPNHHFDYNSGYYPEVFVGQIEYINNVLVDKYIYALNKQLFYFDNYNLLDRKYIIKIRAFVNEKTIEWIKKHKIKRH